MIHIFKGETTEIVFERKGEGNNQLTTFHITSVFGEKEISNSVVIWGEQENLDFLKTMARICEHYNPPVKIPFLQRLNLLRIRLKDFAKRRFIKI